MKSKKDFAGIFGRFKRRDLFRSMGLAAFAGLTGCEKSSTPHVATAPEKPKPRIPLPTYESIGAKHVINARGTMTRLGGSLELPEVKMAMEEASKHFVSMTELAECVGKRLAELTGAEWGCVTSGAMAAMFAGTAACVTGGDREKLLKLPDTTGMKNECLVAPAHRTPFDLGIRMAGVKIIEVNSTKEMEAAFNDRTALIFVWGEKAAPDHPHGGDFPTEEIIAFGNKHGIPILVDAAAERPDVPNIYIEAGCDLVAYSGGKCMRGPNAAGLLLGRKDLVQAAVNCISPNMGLGRPMKVGKEEIIGCLTAMDMWINGRDHDAEWKEWERWLEVIREKIVKVSTVKAEIIPPGRRCNYTPTLTITWDQNTIKLTDEELRKRMWDGEPCIDICYRLGDSFRSRGTAVNPYMMKPGEEVIVGDKLYEIFSQNIS
jgi:D-glucosaminate-6-phosphate ammonia-lyase